MKKEVYSIFIVISLIITIPSVSAQEIEIGSKANQKSIEVTIDEVGNVHVQHIVSASKFPVQVELLNGTVQNLIITDEKNNEQIVTVIGDNSGVMIFPSEMDSKIEYDLKDALFIEENVWKWEILYLDTVKVILPEKLDLIFVNDRPVYLDDQRGIACHGCQMVLTYSINEPKNLFEVNWEDKEFLVEIRSFAEIKQFNFNQPTKQISFNVNEQEQFVIVIIPLELLWEPYTVFLNEETIPFHKYINNGTHAWLNMKPDVIGDISIIGTTVIPEFPIIAPLAIGFLMIMIVPLLRKVSLH